LQRPGQISSVYSLLFLLIIFGLSIIIVARFVESLDL